MSNAGNNPGFGTTDSVHPKLNPPSLSFFRSFFFSFIFLCRSEIVQGAERGEGGGGDGDQDGPTGGAAAADGATPGA